MQGLQFTVKSGVHTNRLPICILGERREIPKRVAFPKLSIDIKLSSVCELLLTMFLVQISLFFGHKLASLFSLEFELIQDVYKHFDMCKCKCGYSKRVFWDMWADNFCDFSAILEEHLKSAGMEKKIYYLCLLHPPTPHRSSTKYSQEWNVTLFLPEQIAKDHIIGLEFRMGRASP